MHTVDLGLWIHLLSSVAVTYHNVAKKHNVLTTNQVEGIWDKLSTRYDALCYVLVCCILLCTPVHSCVLSCTVVYSHVLSYTLMYTCVLLCTVVYSGVEST